MNRELDATFDLAAFEHDASYNAEEGRIEIYFRSLRPQAVTVAGYRFFFAGGERVHTEYSYKYAPAGFPALIENTGFNLAQTWTDEQELFAVLYLTAA
jgi:L-histidine Nalpha-methyltransferase